MSRVNPDELPGSMAVLGLVIEQPNDTVTHIGQCLGSRFQRSRFARSTAHSTLPRLAATGRVRRTYQALGNERSGDRYEATTKGIDAFRAWMYDLSSGESGPGKPALREAMYGRIELCQLRDLPRLIAMARAEQHVSADLYAEATGRLRLHLQRKPDPLDFTRKVREVLLYVDPMHWAARSDRYKAIADRLEDIQREIENAGAEVAGG